MHFMVERIENSHFEKVLFKELLINEL
jgi:hypothetical protein